MSSRSPLSSIPNTDEQGAIHPASVFALIDRVLPFEICLYHQVVPLALVDKTLILGLVCPEDSNSVRYIESLLVTFNCQASLQRISARLQQQLLSSFLEFDRRLKSLGRNRPQSPAEVMAVARSLNFDLDSVGQPPPSATSSDPDATIIASIADTEATSRLTQHNQDSDEVVFELDLDLASWQVITESTPIDEGMDPGPLTEPLPNHVRSLLSQPTTPTTNQAVHPAPIDQSITIPSHASSHLPSHAPTRPPSHLPSHGTVSQKPPTVAPPKPPLDHPAKAYPMDRRLAADLAAELELVLDDAHQPTVLVSVEEHATSVDHPLPVVPPIPTLVLHPRYADRPLDDLAHLLGALPPRPLAQELLQRAIAQGIGRIYIERSSVDSGRILFSQDGILQAAIEHLEPSLVQGAINELKIAVDLPPIAAERTKQVEVERLYEGERLLLRLRISPGLAGEEATLQVLRGAALRFYERQQLSKLGADALTLARQLQKQIAELRARAIASQATSREHPLASAQLPSGLSELRQLLALMQGQLADL